MRIALITARSPLAAAAEPCCQPPHEAALARALAGHGHRVTIYARTEDPGRSRTAILGRGVSVEHVPAGPPRPLTAEQAAGHLPEFARYLSDRWRTRPPDIVHAFSWTSGLVAIGAVRGTEIPVVQSFESLGVAELRHAGNTDVSACRVQLEASVGRSVAAVLASSDEEASELARLAVPKAAIRVVPAGVDTDLFRPDTNRREPAGRARLIAFATAGQARGLQAIIRALTQLPDAELVIAGGPDSRHLPRSGPFRELAQLATALRVRGRVEFAGQVAQTELPDLIRSADVMVSAAPYEPTGVAAIQAMACGIPAVVSGIGAHADAVIEGVTGLLVAPDHPGMLAHRLRALLARPALLQAYGIAAADRARSRYSWDRIGQETVMVYERCLRARSAALSAASLEDELAELEETVDLREMAAFA
jgi:D-inositol-3-phosphate glycosyltransferase